MKFSEVVEQVIALLQRKGRVSYRALKREFDVDEEYLEDLKEELGYSYAQQVKEEGPGLVWTGSSAQTLAGNEAQAPSPRTVAAEPSTPPSEATPVSQPAGSPATPEEKPPSVTTREVPEAERRQLTVMFCDLVGSTSLSGQLDPEDLREVVRAYQETAAKVITRYEGHIAQYLGDGLLVYFGYPRAHEDDARRAVRAGLEIIEAVGTLNTRLEPVKGVRLAVRLGIHTGLVVVGEMGGGNRHEHLALGETPNVAARLQGLAEPDTMVISAVTARLVHSAFAVEDLGTQSLKGVEEPMAVARVLGPVEEQSAEEEEALPARVLFLVGRDEEIGPLRRRWEQSKEGLGQVVLVSGEAGIGKTAVVETIRMQVRHEGCNRITFRCSPYHQNSALYPVIEHLQRRLEFEREEALEAKLAKLERLLGRYRFSLDEAVPLFAALLSIALPEGSYAPLSLSPQQQKQQTHDALAAWLVEEAERKPVLAIWEDVHWADPSTLELMGLALDQAPTLPMLTVLTFRPEFVPPWAMRSHMTPITLNRLERLQVEAMVIHLTGGKSLPAEVVQHVVSKTDGVPLFVEELTKMLLESDLLRPVNGHYELTRPLPSLAIPVTLHDSLMARLDRLPEVREVAQLGAVLGREFAYEMLKALITVEEQVLQARLMQLVDAELLYQRGRPPRAKYFFKHALIQDAAYASLLRNTRQYYHQQIAQLFEQQFSEMVEMQPEVVAHHYTEAGLTEQALAYWQQAGQRASQRSANIEAISHLSQGLELLKTLPDTPERSQQELSLQIALGAVLIATKGHASPEARQAYARARELCEQMGDTPQLFPVLLGLGSVYTVAGELKTAHGLAEQLLSLAHRQQAPTFLLPAHTAFGVASFYLGEPAVAREHFEQGITLYDPHKHSPQVSGVAQDPGVLCRSYAAMVLWLLGYPDQALKRTQEALSLARELAHPFSLAMALNFVARLHQYRRDGQRTHEQAEAAIILSTDQGFPYWLAWGTIMRGWVLVEQAYLSGRWGQGEEGIAQIRQGVAGLRATGAELAMTYNLALLAGTYGRGGQAEEGLNLLAEALAMADKNEERYYEAELYRLKGELLLAQEGKNQKAKGKSEKVTEAEECFHKAIEIARRQQAKSLELRAAMSLARLWQQQGKTEEARQLLAEIYSWFTEGFDTKDLQEAKALLAEL